MILEGCQRHLVSVQRRSYILSDWGQSDRAAYIALNRFGQSFYFHFQIVTYLFILLVLHGVLLERLISNTLQVIHKRLSVELVHCSCDSAGVVHQTCKGACR